MSVMKRSFSRDFKLDVCQRVRLGQATKSSICRQHDLASTLLDQWLVKYDEKGELAFSDAGPVDLERRVRELEASLGRAHLENEFLKEALGKLGIPVKRQP